MERMWIVVADEGRARFFERAGPAAELEEVAQLEDELAHERAAALRRDAQGRLYGKGERVMGHTAEPRTEPHRNEAQRFARRVALYLLKALQAQRYERLQLVAAPAFLGLLRQELSPLVRRQVVGELALDLVHLDRHALARRLGAAPARA
jgi:protein required for attachment to host cells